MAVKKLDYNGLKTLVQYIKFYISQLLSNYLPLSGGTMSGNICYDPIIPVGDGTYTGSCVVSKYGTKGTPPAKNVYFTYHVVRDTSNINSNENTCRYGCYEAGIDAEKCWACIKTYKNEVNSTISSGLQVVYPNTGDPYIQLDSHIKLQSGIELK